MIKLHPEKISTVSYVDKDDPSISFSMTFKFPYTEDKPLKEGEHPMDYILRIAKDSVISTDGIIDSITNNEIELNDNNRKLIYDLIKTIPEYLFSISAAFMGPKGKNWLTGVMALLTTDGHPTNAVHASPAVPESAYSSQTTNEK